MSLAGLIIYSSPKVYDYLTYNYTELLSQVVSSTEGFYKRVIHTNRECLFPLTSPWNLEAKCLFLNLTAP